MWKSLGGGLIVLGGVFIGGMYYEEKFNIFPSDVLDTNTSEISQSRFDTVQAIQPQKKKSETSEAFSWFMESSYPALDNADRKHLSDVVSLEKVDLVYSLVQKYYYGSSKISPEKIEEGLIRGIIYSLDDPYTDFFNEEQGKDFDKNMAGNFEGIGAAMEKQKGNLTITEVMKGLPAAKAGFLPGDIVLKVDGISVVDETIWESILRIRGKKGTPVTIEVFRPGRESEGEKFLTITAIRDNIHIESVEFSWKGKDKNVAVFEISQFGDEMIIEMEKNLQHIIDAQKEGKTLKGIIIDLRYNGGGYLTGAVDLASYFLPDHTKVVTVSAKHPDEDEKYFTKKTFFSNQFIDTNTPLLVLVNGGSASASEIFSGSIQEQKRGKILGEKTFGKGTVQQIFPLEKNPEEFVKITIAKWLLPSGKNLTNDAPLTPDIEVKWNRSEMTDEQQEKNYDPQMDKALEILSQ